MRSGTRVLVTCALLAFAGFAVVLACEDGRAAVGAAVVDAGQALAQPPASSPYISRGAGRVLTTTPPDWDPKVVEELRALGVTTRSRALLLARGDEVVIDLTPNGRGPFPVASISKAIAALAVARAVDEGALGFDDAVFASDDERDVSLRALLSHTSGLDSSLTKVVNPGVPAYHLRAYDLVPDVVERATGVEFAAFVDDHLLRPAGGRGITWNRDADDNALASAGASVSVDDLLVLGQLVLHGGFAPAQQPQGEVLRARTLDEMFHAHGFIARNHGMGWWLQHPTDNALQWDIVEARGGSGHMLSVVPGKHAVLVRIASVGANDTGVPEQFHALLRKL